MELSLAGKTPIHHYHHHHLSICAPTYSLGNSLNLFAKITHHKTNKCEAMASSSSLINPQRATFKTHKVLVREEELESHEMGVDDDKKKTERRGKRRRVFFVDVNPLRYNGNKPCLYTFAYWTTLLLSRVTQKDPVIAVLDGENGNEYRRQLLPSYKAHRKHNLPTSFLQRNSSGYGGCNVYPSSTKDIMDILHVCNIPVLKVKGCEADDVIATLVGKARERGFNAVIASPDKDFKQIISEDVQIVLPMPDLGRWSFYTLKNYVSQYNCDPGSDLSLRCIMGDDVDGVPGLQHVSPGFGRKTAVKLLKKHGTLENLLSAAAIRTVGKPFAQDALTRHADYLRRNFQVLSLRRDVDVIFDDRWLLRRDNRFDMPALCCFFKKFS